MLRLDRGVFSWQCFYVLLDPIARIYLYNDGNTSTRLYRLIPGLERQIYCPYHQMKTVCLGAHGGYLPIQQGQESVFVSLGSHAAV